MQPFRIDIPQAAVDDLHRRLDDTPLCPNEPGSELPTANVHIRHGGWFR